MFLCGDSELSEKTKHQVNTEVNWCRFLVQVTLRSKYLHKAANNTTDFLTAMTIWQYYMVCEGVRIRKKNDNCVYRCNNVI